MESLLDTAPCGFLSSTDDGKIVAINSTLLDILEYQTEELQGQHIDSIMPVASRVFCQTHLIPMLKMHDKVDEIFLSLRTKSGKDIPMLTNAMRWKRQGQMVNDWVFMLMHRRNEYEYQLVRLKKAAEEAHALLETKQAELLELNARLETLTVTDGMTGLKNHRAFQENLGIQIALIKRRPAPLSLLLIDVDHFKAINDTFGHPIGDEYLIQLAQILRENSREGDFVARHGGEEFAVILPDTDDVNAVKVAQKVRRAVESSTWSESAITVSVGVSTFLPEAIGEQTQMVSMADQALYLSKERGRNCVSHANELG